MNYGLDITNKNDLVGICYTMWFNGIFGQGEDKMENCRNVHEMTARYGFSTEYGFGNENEQHNSVPSFHYWGKPAQGYYRSTSKSAAINNLRMISKAGVDFLILDFTYANPEGYHPGTKYWEDYIYSSSKVLLDCINDLREKGERAPYVVFWFSGTGMFRLAYDNFYSVEKWKNCFVYWNGKPFILGWNYSDEGLSDPNFTVRFMYGLQYRSAPYQWSYLEPDNLKTVCYDINNKAEHISVSVATQVTYMSLPTAHGRDGGRFWNAQWKNAFEIRPKIVSVTWWNEWCAQLYKVDGVGYVFTDNFNHEYSRDIEPMEGGHGDKYYKWLCEYVKSYKAKKSCPLLVD